jgi:hypothetical protein
MSYNNDRLRRMQRHAAWVKGISSMSMERPTPPAGSGLPVRLPTGTVEEGQTLFLVDYTSDEVRVTAPIVAAIPAGAHGLWLVDHTGKKHLATRVHLRHEDAQQRLNAFRLWAAQQEYRAGPATTEHDEDDQD